MVGRKHSEVTREKISKRCQEAGTPELHALRMRNIEPNKPRTEKGAKAIRDGKRKSGGWKIPWANKTIWAMADVIYQQMLDTPSKGYSAVQKLVGISKEVGNISNIFNKIKSTGWIPLEDSEWVIWKLSQLNNKELSK